MSWIANEQYGVSSDRGEAWQKVVSLGRSVAVDYVPLMVFQLRRLLVYIIYLL
jgi:hypothetical protein